MRGYVERYALYLGAAIALLLTGCDSRTGAYAGDRAASRAACAEAQTALSRGDVAAAKAAWDRAVKLDPADPEPHAARGRHHWAMRQFREAAEAFEQASRRAPDDVEILMALIQTRQDAGDQTRTEELARRAVQLAPDNPKARVYLGAYLSALSDRPGALDEARAHLQRAAQLAPGMPIPLIELGKAMKRQGRYAEAETYLKTAWETLFQHRRTLRQLENMGEVERQRAETAYALAMCARAQNRQKEASQWFTRFKEVDARIERRSALSSRALSDPPDLNALLELARLNNRNGGAEESVSLLRRALQIAPDNPNVRALAAETERLLTIPAP
jgi:Flp pilus assembly protein TadD